MKFRLITVTIATAAGLSLLAAPATAADEPGRPPSSRAPSDWMPEDAALTLQTDRGSRPTSEATTSATYPSPSNCRGKSNNPHQSTTTGTYGYIKGYSETYCDANVPYIEVTATVWRKRWWGYQHVGTDGDGSTTWWYKIGRSGVYAGCENNRWRTVGYHVAKDVDGEYYSMETQNYNDITCW